MEAKTVLPSSDRFRRLPYLTDNLPLVITNTTHTLGPVGSHLGMIIHLHTQAHKVIFFWKGTIQQVFHAYSNKKAISQQSRTAPLTLASHHIHERMTYWWEVVWFQLVILSIVDLFIIVMWHRSSYMDHLMFYGLACLSFLRISFSLILIVIIVFSDQLLPFSKLPDYRHCICFRQYRIDFVFEKKMKMKVIWSHIGCFRSVSSLGTPQFYHQTSF
jgi:hypothetical protein